VAWFVYMVQCRDASLYTGATNDLSRRVKAHSDGKGARYTRSRRPVTLVFSRRVKDRSSALKLEAKLKRLSRAEKLTLVSAARRRRPARSHD
jgi:putative endonuclease